MDPPFPPLNINSPYLLRNLTVSWKVITPKHILVYDIVGMDKAGLVSEIKMPTRSIGPIALSIRICKVPVSIVSINQAHMPECFLPSI